MEDTLVTGHKAQAFSGHKGKGKKKKGYDKDWPMLIVDVIQAGSARHNDKPRAQTFGRQHTKTLVCILTRLHSTLVGA